MGGVNIHGRKSAKSISTNNELLNGGQVTESLRERCQIISLWEGRAVKGERERGEWEGEGRERGG